MSGVEQRQSIRLPVPQESDEAVLRIGRRTITAQLVDASSGGFGVRVDDDAGLIAGQSIVLGSGTGWSRVRVAHLRNDEEGLYVGLERVGELPPDWQKKTFRRFVFWDSVRFQPPQISWSTWAAGGGLVILVGLMAVVWRVMPKRDSLSFVSSAPHYSSSSYTSGSGPAVPPPSTRPTRVGESWTYAPPPRIRPNSTTTAAPANSVEKWTYQQSRQAENLVQGLGELSELMSTPLLSGSPREAEEFDVQAATLLTPHVANRLDITPEQRTEISNIVRSTSRAVEDAYRNSSDFSSPSLRRKIAQLRHDANQRALAVLTSQQLRELRNPPQR